MFDRFDQDALRAVIASQDAARDLGNAAIGTEHLLAGLVSEEWFASAQLLTNLGVSSSEIRSALQLPEPGGERPPMGRHVPFDRSMKRTVERSTKEATARGSDRVGTEHLLLALLRVDEGDGALVLKKKGVSYSAARLVVTESGSGP